MRLPGSSLLLLEGEKFSDFNFQNLGELFQSSDRRRIHATFHQTDELDRTANRLRKLLLRELSAFAETGNSLTEFLLKHAV